MWSFTDNYFAHFHQSYRALRTDIIICGDAAGRRVFSPLAASSADYVIGQATSKETYRSHADLLWLPHAGLPHFSRLQPSLCSLCSRSLSCQRWLGDMTSCRKWRVTCGPFWLYLGSMQFGDSLFGFVRHFTSQRFCLVNLVVSCNHPKGPRYEDSAPWSHCKH